MSSQSLLIRSAESVDVPKILTMIRELAEFEQLACMVTASEERLTEDLFGARPSVECVVALLGDEPVAYTTFCHHYSTFLAKRSLYLEDIYVKPIARGCGVGTALLVHLAQVARARDCCRFEWTVLDWNERAIRFYDGLGAKPLSDWRIYRVTGDALAQLAAMGRCPQSRP
jgi:GNAT superfamily N-acetyltransferase